MQTFDQALIKAYGEGLITQETAELYATRKAVVQRGLDKVKQSRGQKTTDIEGLALDTGYAKTVKKKRNYQEWGVVGPLTSNGPLGKELIPEDAVFADPL